MVVERNSASVLIGGKRSPKQGQLFTENLCRAKSQQEGVHGKKLRFQGSEVTPKCCHCQEKEDETLEHFLLSCTKYEAVREELLAQLQHKLTAIGDCGVDTWRQFSAGSRDARAQILLGMLSINALVDEAITEFRSEYAARAWSDRIVI